MNKNMAQVRQDLRYVFGWFPLDCLLHVRANQRRLIRNRYSDDQGRGCLFFLLSELLPEEERIYSRESLTRFFTGASGHPARESSQYQPARWLVRLIDEIICDRVRARYGDVQRLEWDVVMACLDECIHERQDQKQQSKATERRANSALQPLAVAL